MDITILAIESSCDDTSASVLRNGSILSNIVNSQLIHKKYGGVVPEVASREHQINIVPVVDSALKDAIVQVDELSAIAFTIGPGLLGSLMVGVSFAKAMALSLNIPLIEVHHIQAHVVAHFIDSPKPDFPFLCLIVSGGHTQIAVVTDHLEMQIIGETRDDAAGEAFDKSGKLLGLSYPAGPVIDQLASLGEVRFHFPEPNIPGLDFSFSGLKTAILYFLRDRLEQDPGFVNRELSHICASIQHTIVKILLDKLKKAVESTGIREVAICGGVSANSLLRNRFESLGRECNWNCYIPKFEYCTDNAAMIAITAYYKYQKGEFASQEIVPKARLDINLQ